MKSKKLSQQAIILSSLFWQYLSTGLMSVIRLGVLAVLSRLLSPNDFGLVGIASIFTNLALIISQLGVGPAIIQSESTNATQIRVGYSISIVFGLLLFCLVILFAPVIAIFFNASEIRYLLPVIGFSFFLSSFGIVSQSLMQKQLRFKELLWVDLGSYFVGYGAVGIVMASLGYGPWSLVFAQLAQSFLSSIMVMLLSPHSIIPLFTKKESKELLNFGFGITLARIFNYCANQGDYFVVGKMMGVVPLGLYTRAYQIMLFPAQYVGATLEKVFFPVISKVQSDPEKVKRYFLSSTFAVSLLCVPITIMILYGATDIVNILLGPKWKDVVLPLQILALGIQYRTAYKIGDSVAKATGLVYQRSVRELIYAIMVIAGASIGVNWGIGGVSVGVLIAITVNFLMVSNMSMRNLRISAKEFLATQYPGLFISLFLLLTIYPIKLWLKLMNINSVFSLGILIFVTILFFALIIIIYPKVLGAYRNKTILLLDGIFPMIEKKSNLISHIFSRIRRTDEE